MIQVQSRVLVIIWSWLCVLLAWLASTAPQARHRGLLQVYDLPGGCRLEPAVQYAHSAACHQSLRGIATVVLPNRPADAEAGGSGAAGRWAGPSKLAGGTMARPRPSITGASVHIVYDLLIFILCPGSYTISYSPFTIS